MPSYGTPIRIEADSTLVLLDGLTPEQSLKAVRSAIKKTSRTTKVRIIKAITYDLNLKKSDIDANSKGSRNRAGSVRLSQARSFAKGQPLATISITGGRISLPKLGVSPKTPQSTKGVEYVLRGGKRKRKPRGKQVRAKIRRNAGSTLLPRAFLMMTDNLHLGVFQRKSGRRNDLVELKGPSLPAVAQKNAGVQSVINVEAGEILERNLSSQVDRFLERSKT